MARSPMRIEFRRSGGFAGVALKAATTSDQLPGEHAARLQELLAAGEQAPGHGASPGGADQFHYQLELSDGRRHRSFGWDESQVPEYIRPVLNALTRLARQG